MKKKIIYLFLGLFIMPILNVKAASGYYDIYTSNKKPSPGSTFTVTVKCVSKTSEKIGLCEYTLDYDSSKIKLISEHDTASCHDGYCAYNAFSTLSAKTFTFKAIATGYSRISVKSYSILSIDTEKPITTTVDPTSVTIKNPEPTKPVTYSTNNNLKSLTITGYNLEQTFNKDTLTYTVKVPSSVEEITINATKEDSTANIVGTGKFKVSEGENKFDIIVTSQKGTKKTYTIKVTVLDENPIEVKINDNTYTIIKRKSSLKIPESGLFTNKEITINDTKIPALYNETTNYTLIGLKDNDGNTNLYIYNEEDNTYTLYQEIIFNKVKVNIIDKKVDNLNPKIVDYLKSKNAKLYKHQSETYEAIQNDENVIITTPTASGKTLAFNLPIMETMIEDEDATALYIYPAKALSNDQLHVLENLEKSLDIKINPNTYDGDTPKSKRYDIRQKSRIILTNPYQLHLILSWHHQWKRFYSNLKFIVIDESHYYKGIFGSNVAYLIRRLKRIANFYGANPQFILSSATLANPLELANRLTGEKFRLVDNDTSPSGEKDFILYNPFRNYRRKKHNSEEAPSVHIETENIFVYLMLKDIQTLCFTVSRKITELIAMWAKKDMDNIKKKLTHRITAYRAGYQADERHEIEDGLKSRKYLGVTCTNALELGINIGSLDRIICLVVKE